MSSAELRNAIIKSARITNENGILDAWLDLDYGGSGQGFGGFVLYLPKSYRNHDPSGPNYAGHFIWRVMDIAGVSEWSKLVGKTIRVKSEHSAVHAIGHIINDDWFCPKEDFEALKARAPAPATAGKEVTAEELEPWLFQQGMVLSSNVLASALLSTYKITKRSAT